MTSTSGCEEWRDVVGYEGLYKVNSNGDVYSIKRDKILKATDKRGYMLVCLTKDKKPKHHHVHRLVAKAFLENPDNKEQIDHINQDKSDNRVENLRWVTSTENMDHSFGTKVECVEEKIVFPSGARAGHWLVEKGKTKTAKTKTASKEIFEACRKGAMAYGYHWRFVEDDMGRMSREKGKRGEREVANILKDHGYDAKRGVQYQGSPDSPDVVGLPGVHIEVKRTEKLDLYGALQQSKDDSGDAELPVVVHRRNGKDWVAILPFEDFLRLYGEKRP